VQVTCLQPSVDAPRLVLRYVSGLRQVAQGLLPACGAAQVHDATAAHCQGRLLRQMEVVAIRVSVPGAAVMVHRQPGTAVWQGAAAPGSSSTTTTITTTATPSWASMVRTDVYSVHQHDRDAVACLRGCSGRYTVAGSRARASPRPPLCWALVLCMIGVRTGAAAGCPGQDAGHQPAQGNRQQQFHLLLQ